jgi:hypothetical protein
MAEMGKFIPSLGKKLPISPGCFRTAMVPKEHMEKYTPGG